MNCGKRLGSNEMFETFPVGQRLVFDGARGRLWVVCPHCERWILSPFEERLEAIEEAERLYAVTRKRVASDNIGLAKLRDGTTIIRIGEPRRREFAAWRYGRHFGRRSRRRALIAAGGVMAVAGGVGAAIGSGYAFGAFVLLGRWMLFPVLQGREGAVIARIRTPNDGIVRVRRRHLRETTIGRTSAGTMLLHLAHANGSTEFEGRAAHKVAAVLAPKLNRHGGFPKEVQWAVEAIEECGGSDEYLEEAARIGPMYTRRFGLFSLPRVHALAFEMALHEDAERHAMQGELAELADEWRYAEEGARGVDAIESERVDGVLRKLKEKMQ